MSHNFGQEPCRCDLERLDHESRYAARDNLYDLCLRQAVMELDNAATQDEIDDRAAELMREME